MNSRRVRELKIKYVTSLIEVLRIICEAGERTEEHAEAVRQIERSMLSCLNRPPTRAQKNKQST